MTPDLEAKLVKWSKPPSVSEQERSANAERIIRNAIQSSDELTGRNVRIFLQGSYRNRTNFRIESDVDVGVLCADNVFFFNLPDEKKAQDFGIITPAAYPYHDFRSDVAQALTSYIGVDKVVRGNKAFNIRETSYHVDADVTPFFEHRRYATDGSYISGVKMLADDGTAVINWPEQHYSNGVAKNDATGKRYKAVVRALKGINSELPENISTFLIECLVWNVPNGFFGSRTLADDIAHALAYLYEKLGAEDSNEWGEVSELKYLFRAGQKWTKQQARDFALAAWNYGGF